MTRTVTTPPKQKTKVHPHTDEEAKRESDKLQTASGPFVHEEMHHYKEQQHKKGGKQPIKNRKQAIAIGLSKARRAGVAVPPKYGNEGERSTRKRTSPKQSATAKATKRRTNASSYRSRASSGSRKATTKTTSRSRASPDSRKRNTA